MSLGDFLTICLAVVIGGIPLLIIAALAWAVWSVTTKRGDR